LRTFANAVQDGLRASDFFGRYGGEESSRSCRKRRQQARWPMSFCDIIPARRLAE